MWGYNFETRSECRVPWKGRDDLVHKRVIPISHYLNIPLLFFPYMLKISCLNSKIYIYIYIEVNGADLHTPKCAKFAIVEIFLRVEDSFYIFIIVE